jgi:ribosomal protein S18 acetylase RimI-like enzyme
MLKEMTSQAAKLEVRELLGYSVFPDPDQVEKAVSLYKAEGWSKLYGYVEEGLLVGIIGCDIQRDEVTIRHLAVLPENRGKGYGRGMILELLLQLDPKPKRVIAETDDEAVDFYRNIGFEVHSLGEKYPGVERFRCIYEVDEETSD